MVKNNHLTRATKGFESALDWMFRRDNFTHFHKFKDGLHF